MKPMPLMLVAFGFPFFFMPSRNSRAMGAPLDPYGIYGTRTQARLRASRRRRQTQNFILILLVLGVAAGALALSRWRREATDVAQLKVKAGAPIALAPIFVAATKTNPAALLVATRDGELLRWDDIENDESDAAADLPGRNIVLRDDFPIHTPLLTDEYLFVPSESGVLTALAWRTKKVLWRRTFDDALTAQPVVFSLLRAEPSAASPPAPTSATAPPTAPAISPAPAAAMPAAAMPAAIAPTPEAPKVSRRRIVVAASDAGLVMGIDIGSGQILWRARMPAPVGNALAVAEANGRARVLVPLLGGTAMRGGVWCLDGATGKLLWRFPKDARAEAIQFSAPCPDLPGNRAYFGNDLGAVFALNLTTGTYDAGKKIGWKNFLTPLRKNSSAAVSVRAAPLVLNSPAADDASRQILILGGSDGLVRALSARTGSTLWSAEAQAPVISLARLDVSGEPSRILVVSRSSQMLVLDAPTGKVLRRLSAHGETFTGAAVSQQSIFAATESGAIHRFARVK